MYFQLMFVRIERYNTVIITVGQSISKRLQALWHHADDFKIAKRRNSRQSGVKCDQNK